MKQIDISVLKDFIDTDGRVGLVNYAGIRLDAYLKSIGFFRIGIKIKGIVYTQYDKKNSTFIIRHKILQNNPSISHGEVINKI